MPHLELIPWHSDPATDTTVVLIPCLGKLSPLVQGSQWVSSERLGNQSFSTNRGMVPLVLCFIFYGTCSRVNATLVLLANRFPLVLYPALMVP
ncbi:unnamed protein product [Bursaphelenchus okinawaensis]|uniref:Uncharacterized protein n=1 Tax=Bursaphelenchus okinawaensis TaxID=465554 RepID=A0A811KBK0_9BILA|nr:unnamed protein product [Bursaphelenchus okinawaensis]CAG9101016.1 unnamed protein product [Bursaphelenchus okinawaensis]